MLRGVFPTLGQACLSSAARVGWTDHVGFGVFPNPVSGGEISSKFVPTDISIPNSKRA